VQIFDTWVGALTPADYRDHVQPHVLRVFESLRGLGVPTVHFGIGTGELLTLMADAGGDAIGVDHRLALDDAWSRIGRSRAIQGNLDPAALLAPWDTTAAKAREVLTAAGSRNGHVFNLGHGVLPDTRIEQLQRLVDLVHTESARSEA
jgi:uroporphyrinogen decarboxylase